MLDLIYGAILLLYAHTYTTFINANIYAQKYYLSYYSINRIQNVTAIFKLQYMPVFIEFRK